MKLLEMSISAGMLIGCLALLRTWDFWNQPKRTVRMLWIVAVVRLLLPVSLPVQGGIASCAYRMLAGLQKLHPDAGSAGASRGVADGISDAAQNAASLGIAGHAPQGFAWQVLFWGWAAGTAGIGMYFIHMFWKEYRLLAQALPLKLQDPPAYAKVLECCRTASRLAGMRIREGKGPVFVHDRISSPLVYGIIRQRVVLPKSLLPMDPDQLQYVLVHEMVHIKRWDNLWKLLSAAAVCIHWFNPMVWVMYLLFARDLELACDEQVLSVYSSRGRQGYAMTLLTLMENQKETTLFCSGFGKNPVKERIVAIMKYKKLSGMGIVCSFMLLAGATSAFAANAKAAGATGQQAEGKDAAGQQAEGKDAAGQQADGENIAPVAGEDGLVTYTITKTKNGEQEVTSAGTAKVSDGDGGTVVLTVKDVVKDGLYTDENGNMYLFQEGKEGTQPDDALLPYYYFDYTVLADNGEESEVSIAVNGDEENISTLTVNGKEYRLKRVGDAGNANQQAAGQQTDVSGTNQQTAGDAGKQTDAGDAGNKGQGTQVNGSAAG